MSLRIVIPKRDDVWDEAKNKFVSVKETSLVLEHSLVSISKWEAKWKRPFLHDGPKNTEEVLDYIKCMTLTQNVDPNVYLFLTNENIKQITAYLEDPMTATTVTNHRNPNSRQNKEILTSELIYYYMAANSLPIEFQKWHINRLLMLLTICGIKNSPDNQKMNKRETASYYAALNKARRAKKHSKG